MDANWRANSLPMNLFLDDRQMFSGAGYPPEMLRR
jgi:hypothetical protein